jgi:hypothetical protein
MCESIPTSVPPGGSGILFEITREPGKSLSRAVACSEMIELFRGTEVTKIIGGVH